MAPADMKPKVKVIYGSPDIGTWIGGSILVSLPQMASMFVTQEEFIKGGVAVLDKKCP